MERILGLVENIDSMLLSAICLCSENFHFQMKQLSVLKPN